MSNDNLDDNLVIGKISGSSNTKDSIIAIAKPTLRRLPVYYQFLKKQSSKGTIYISCTEIAQEMGLNSIQVRKDLQMTGAVGRPKVGYHVESAIEAIEQSIGYNNTKEAFLVGAGHLGMALLGYKGFEEYGLNIVTAFDTDPEKIGREYRGKVIQDIAKFSNLVNRMNIQIGIITVPAERAEKICSLMVNSGIKAIWNFAPLHLSVPPGVIVLNENMAASFSILSKELMNLKSNSKE